MEHILNLVRKQLAPPMNHIIILPYLSYCSIAVKRHHEQGVKESIFSLYIKESIVGLLTVSEGSSEPLNHGGDHGSQKAGMMLEQELRAYAHPQAGGGVRLGLA